MPQPYLWVVLAPVAGLTGNFLAHLATSWLTAGRKTLAGFIVGFLAGLGVAFSLTLGSLLSMEAEASDLVSFLFLNTITYLALAYGYANFINLNIASLRVRLLQELLATPQGIKLDEILARYNANEMFEKRIRRLLGGHQILLRDERFYTRPSSLLTIARLMWLLKILILGGRRSPSSMPQAPAASAFAFTREDRDVKEASP